ncbi:hypothetical protein PoB_004181300 [Plakobranchus ocellatus]|uniref:Uncharacterized protein n=1 Tax=Plakobranchus ocellatus TaxID=259542 RepID=A0AAV4B6S6_9GAST|nr:hypothetical protein PoB_004181300 [Plakobranchus ocellatus]
MWTCSFIPLTTYAFTPNHFIVLHNKVKSPVVDLTFVFADHNHDDDSASATAAVACVGNDDEDDDTAAVADISGNGTVDYDEDEADDYDDDAVDKDGHFVSAEPDILPGGKSLPLGRFFETEKVIEILQRTSVNDTLSEVPKGKKNDVYFVVQNENNKDRRAQGKRSQFWDDRGAWECNSTSRSFFLQENEKLWSVTYRQTKYCIQVIQNKNYVQIPPNPQPQAEDVLVLSRYYAKHKSGAGYEKRVSFMHSEKFPALAVHEFKGCCPELKHHAYVRTKPQVIDKIKEEVIVKKVGEIYSSNEDILEGPSNRRQIYNIKARSQTKSQVIPKANFADQVSALEELQHTMPFVKLIVRQYKKVPSVILYTEEQISDIKRFCCPPVTAESTVLGFDKTFNLSNIHVTVSVYKCLAVKRRSTNDHSIFCGPLLIHGNSDKDTFFFFFCTIYLDN